MTSVIEPRSDHWMSLSWKYGDGVDFTDIIEQLQQQVKVRCARATKHCDHEPGKIREEGEDSTE